METKRIKVTINTLGNPSIEAIGFSGQDCTQATKGLEGLFAGKGGVTREFKQEWEETASNEQHEQQSWS